MLGGVLIYAALSCLGLHVFLHPVHCGIGDHAGNRNRMTDMLAELDSVAPDLPGAALRRSELVLIGAIARLKAARERPRLLMGGFFALRRSQSGSISKHEQRKKCHRDLDFHPLPPKVRIEKRKNRQELGQSTTHTKDR